MTPELDLDQGLMLKPVSKSILPSLLEAYNEDPVAAQTALPWLDASFNCLLYTSPSPRDRG